MKDAARPMLLTFPRLIDEKQVNQSQSKLQPLLSRDYIACGEAQNDLSISYWLALGNSSDQYHQLVIK